MTTETLLQRAAELLTPFAKDSARPESNRLDVAISANDLPAAAETLSNADWGYLSAITGMDLAPEADELEALYHFCDKAAVTTLRVRLPRAGRPEIPSISPQIPAAAFFERELGEMLGVTVVGTPDPSRLFLPDDWPEGVYPLRRDFKRGWSARPTPRGSSCRTTGPRASIPCGATSNRSRPRPSRRRTGPRAEESGTNSSCRSVPSIPR
ncbi:MAG: hypothetical protein B6D40_10610 [Anaerolineae bacterium UTCFX3]|nr:MAG: hypothetical protein B6D40_10610 [Anaerolineae bacterium UTCFX3]